MKVAKKRRHSSVSSAKVTKGSKETMTEKNPKPNSFFADFTEEKVTLVSSPIVDDRESWNFGGKTWEVNTLQLVS